MEWCRQSRQAPQAAAMPLLLALPLPLALLLLPTQPLLQLSLLTVATRLGAWAGIALGATTHPLPPPLQCTQPLHNYMLSKQVLPTCFLSEQSQSTPSGNCISPQRPSSMCSSETARHSSTKLDRRT